MKFRLPQTVTYWAPSTPTGFGTRTFSTPTTLDCRWEDVSVEFIDQQGETVVSKSRIYLDTDVVPEGMLYLGTSTAATPPATAERIRQVKRTPSLDGTQFLYTVML